LIYKKEHAWIDRTRTFKQYNKSQTLQFGNYGFTETQGVKERTITPRLRESSYVLWAVADGLPTPVEKFLVIKEWMEKNAGK